MNGMCVLVCVLMGGVGMRYKELREGEGRGGIKGGGGRVGGGRKQPEIIPVHLLISLSYRSASHHQVLPAPPTN